MPSPVSGWQRNSEALLMGGDIGPTFLESNLLSNRNRNV